MSTTTRTDPATPLSKPPASGLKALVRTRPVLAYFVLTFLISWGGALLVVAVGPGRIPLTPEEFRPYFPYAFLASNAGPVASGLLLTVLLDGRAGLHKLRARLLEWAVGHPLVRGRASRRPTGRDGGPASAVAELDRLPARPVHH